MQVTFDQNKILHLIIALLYVMMVCIWFKPTPNLIVQQITLMQTPKFDQDSSYTDWKKILTKWPKMQLNLTL